VCDFVVSTGVQTMKRVIWTGWFIMLVWPVFVNAARYYGVDQHASIASNCLITADDGNTPWEVVYEVHGNQCGPDSADFDIIFITGKESVNSNSNISDQEDRWINLVTNRILTNATVVSDSGPGNDQYDGIQGRSRTETLTMTIPQGTARATVTMFADNSNPKFIYVTGIVATVNVRDPNIDTTTKASVDAVLHSVKIGNSGN
jgi:hypothetical protein